MANLFGLKRINGSHLIPKWMLINRDLGVWRTNVVQQSFLPHETQLILGIPFSQRSTANRVVWSFTPNGSFSTSSAYKLLTNLATSGSAGSFALEPQKSLEGCLATPSTQKNQAFHMESLQQCPPYEKQFGLSTDRKFRPLRSL